MSFARVVTQYVCLAGVSILSATLSACAGATVQQLTKRASFDMNCPPEQLEVHEIDPRTRGVRGCGKQATYVQMCDQNQYGPYNCTWVMNTDSGSRR